jgi:hypothetical protein
MLVGQASFLGTIMQFPAAAFDPDLLKLMSRVYEEACSDDAVQRCGAPSDVAQTMIALRIMTSVRAGERSAERLRLLALQAIDGRKIGQAA